MPINTNDLIPSVCPICSHSVAVKFFDGGNQTLATLGWPKSAEEARSMTRYPQDFVQCPNCSHVWNRSFTYDAIPYQKNPNRMFNKGQTWSGHLAVTRDLLLKQLPINPTIIDIGCGEGHFVRALANARENIGRFVGFDPNTTPETGQNVEFHATYFEPLKHIQVFLPDAIVIRHVLEHLTNPVSLLEQLAWAASIQQKSCWLFVEVPCIDRVFETNRLADFFYEHVSHFTTDSFITLMKKTGEIIELSHGYNREVVFSLVKLNIPSRLQLLAEQTYKFSTTSEDTKEYVSSQLDELAKNNQCIAIWGGTGKAAAFIHQFRADAQRFPLVVDSDPEKVGTFVPGTGQKIMFRDVLKNMPVEVIIIPAQWRAKDISAEIEREGIKVKTILIELNGKLVDFRKYKDCD